MKLSIIVAMDRNNAIGKNNELPWRLPADLANFKAITTGKNVIMGSKTWESLGCRPLPNRGNLIVTRSPEGYINGREEHTDMRLVTFHTSIDLAIKALERIEKDTGKEQEVMIIGGASVYQQTLARADRIYLSRIDIAVEGADAFFPEIDRDVFQVDYTMTHLPDGQKHTHRWTYQILNRIAGV
ncbi:dihydrofolate reductase [Salmonella enterica subsp. enterica serovar Newport]|nr:dihydrofolate reductase [Salmonella enterica subsp. enterica serovar Muenchen]